MMLHTCYYQLKVCNYIKDQSYIFKRKLNNQVNGLHYVKNKSKEYLFYLMIL